MHPHMAFLLYAHDWCGGGKETAGVLGISSNSYKDISPIWSRTNSYDLINLRCLIKGPILKYRTVTLQVKASTYELGGHSPSIMLGFCWILSLMLHFLTLWRNLHKGRNTLSEELTWTFIWHFIENVSLFLFFSIIMSRRNLGSPPID